MGNPPRVTVLLASRDRLTFLKEAVASALAQTYPNFEVLIVDDGSAAETTAWLSSEADRHHNMRVSLQEHRGVGAARAKGVRESAGQIVCILDSDDLLAPDALKLVVEELEKTPKADLVYIDNFYLLPNGRHRERHHPAFRTNRAMIWATLLYPRVPFKHTGTTYTREVALAVGSYDPGLPCKVDIDFFLKFLKSERRLRLLRTPVAVFRVHGRSVSRDRKAGIAAWFQLIDRHGPASSIVRWALKVLRASVETLKWVLERLLVR